MGISSEASVPSGLRLLLESDPSVWKECADVFRITADQWAARIAADNPLIRESILLKANNEREELAPPGSSSVEQVLADGLVLSRLQKQYFELQAAAVGGDPDVIGSKLGDALHKRLSSFKCLHSNLAQTGRFRFMKHR